jgi:hypothetical protein
MTWTLALLGGKRRRRGHLPFPGHQLIDADWTHSLHAVACRNHAAVAWVVMWDLPAYPERYAARLATSGRVPSPSPYLLLADTLGGIREMLPPGLVRSERMPVDPPEVVEIWFAG